jgi:hypothetical protein
VAEVVVEPQVVQPNAVAQVVAVQAVAQVVAGNSLIH